MSRRKSATESCSLMSSYLPSSALVRSILLSLTTAVTLTVLPARSLPAQMEVRQRRAGEAWTDAEEEFETDRDTFTFAPTTAGAGRTITEADLVSFVNATGMIGELFTNAELARDVSPVGVRPVPGLLALAFAEALNAQGPIRGSGLALLALERNEHRLRVRACVRA